MKKKQGYRIKHWVTVTAELWLKSAVLLPAVKDPVVCWQLNHNLTRAKQETELWRMYFITPLFTLNIGQLFCEIFWSTSKLSNFRRKKVQLNLKTKAQAVFLFFISTEFRNIVMFHSGRGPKSTEIIKSYVLFCFPVGSITQSVRPVKACFITFIGNQHVIQFAHVRIRTTKQITVKWTESSSSYFSRLYVYDSIAQLRLHQKSTNSN